MWPGRDTFRRPSGRAFADCSDICISSHALTVPFPWWMPSSSNEKLVNTVIESIKLRGNWIVFVDERKLRALGRIIRSIADSEVYRRIES
jgi:hypothetical protein